MVGQHLIDFLIRGIYMIISKFHDVKILAIAAAVSNNWTKLEEISDEDSSVLKKFTKKTGVEGRYNAGLRQTTSDFCYAAAREIIKEKQVNIDDIGILVFVTQSADYAIPATACLLQDRLGLRKDCIAFDVNLGCSGFSYGLNIVASLLKNTNCKKALLLCGDTSAKVKSPKNMNKTTHSASLLFGDSGTATLIGLDDTAQRINMISKTDGSGFKAIIKPYDGFRNPDDPSGKNASIMDDVAVFNFAISEVPSLLKDTMELASMKPEDYDCLVLHQANLFIMKQVAKRTGFSMDKTLVSIDKFGNTSSSSLPITLVNEYGNEKESKEIHALMCGFGVGLSWSTVDCYINTNDILPLVHTDEYFTDGYTPEE